MLTPQGFSSANGILREITASASAGISECRPNTNAKSTSSRSSRSLLDEYSVLPNRAAMACPFACSASETATTSIPLASSGSRYRGTCQWLASSNATFIRVPPCLVLTSPRGGNRIPRSAGHAPPVLHASGGHLGYDNHAHGRHGKAASG